MRPSTPWTREQEAVLAHPLDAHALVRAVPGSGKTTTLVGRVARLCHAGVKASEIRVVMFNRAIEEHFRLRLQDLGIWDVRVSTFDSLGLEVIRAAQRTGLLTRELEVIVDGTAQWARAISKRYRETIQDDEELMNAIAYWKAHLVSPARASFPANEHLVDAYKDFEDLRLERGILRVAFADMVYTAVGILKDNPRLLGNVSHFIVDEFQDVNYARVTLLQRLSSEDTSITAVGDEDQGINEWCGAHPRYLRDFSTFFPWKSVREYPLSSSFRFGAEIAGAATRLIRNNASRDTLEIVGAGPNVGAIIDVDDIPTTIDLLVAEGVPPNEIAVLYRARTQGVGTLSQIASRRIPMETEDFDRLRKSRAAEFVIGYLRLALSNTPPTMDDAWRIVYAPDRYIQKEAFSRQLTARRADLATVLGDRALAQELGQPPSAVDAMSQLSGTLQRIRQAPSIDDALSILLARVDILNQLNGTFSSERQKESNDANFKAICHLLRHLGVLPFLAEATLATLDPTGGVPSKDRVWVSTIHKAKGREWRCVFLPRLAEGLSPAQRLGDAIPGTRQDPEGIEQSPWIEQERRIFYVGVTRASERVFLQPCAVAPSRFLAELRPSPLRAKHRRRRRRDRGARGAESNVEVTTVARPRAHGQPWNDDDDNALITAWRMGAKIAAIADVHGRSVGSIAHRVVRLGLARDVDEAMSR